MAKGNWNKNEINTYMNMSKIFNSFFDVMSSKACFHYHFNIPNNGGH